MTKQGCQATGFRPGCFPGGRGETWGLGGEGDWKTWVGQGAGSSYLGFSEKEKKFFSAVSHIFEKNSQLNPGKKEISLFKTVVFFFFCETTSLQVRRELPPAHASRPHPSHSQPAPPPQSCLDL